MDGCLEKTLEHLLHAACDVSMTPLLADQFNMGGDFL